MKTVETARLGSVLGESTGGKGLWAKEEERERRGGREAGKEAEGKEAEGRRGRDGRTKFLAHSGFLDWKTAGSTGRVAQGGPVGAEGR